MIVSNASDRTGRNGSDCTVCEIGGQVMTWQRLHDTDHKENVLTLQRDGNWRVEPSL